MVDKRVNFKITGNSDALQKALLTGTPCEQPDCHAEAKYLVGDYALCREHARDYRAMLRGED